MGAQAVAPWANATPHAVAITEGQDSYTYETFASRIAQAAAMSRSAGLRQGMIVGTRCDAQYLHFVPILASEVIRGTHFSMAPSDLMFDSELSDRCDMMCVETLTEPVAKHPRVIVVSRATIGELTRLRTDGTATTALEACQTQDMIVRIATTSCTTGHRKFVGNTRRSIQHIVAGARYALKNNRDRHGFVSMYRFNLIGTYLDALLAIGYGMTVAYCTKEDFLPTLRRLPSCRTMLLLNEASFVALMDHDPVGTILPDAEVKIVDDMMRTRNTGEPGIIMIRSPRLVTGYLWDDALDAEYFIDGWFRSSDIGVIPEPGKLIVIGRVDDILNIGALKVAAFPIEEGIRSIGGVAGTVVLNAANTHGVDEAHVFIERRDPALDGRIDQALVALPRRHVTTFAAHHATRFPRAPTGKAQRDRLRDRLSQKA